MAAGGVDNCVCAACEVGLRQAWVPSRRKRDNGDAGGRYTLFSVVVDCGGRVRLGDHNWGLCLAWCRHEKLHESSGQIRDDLNVELLKL